MILADTSIWIDHLRRGDPEIERLLLANAVRIHPFVIGELALGDLQQRRKILTLLHNLPQAVSAQDSEVMLYIERFSIAGLGIGYVDAHLLTSTRLGVGSRLWTRDKRLARIADDLGLGYQP